MIDEIKDDLRKGSPSSLQGQILQNYSYDEQMRILAVDDNDWILMNLSRLPSSVKHKMEAARNADAAFDMYLKLLDQRKIYHMMFIDVKMPKKDGVELTRQIRAYEKERFLKSSYICGMKTDDDDPDDKAYLEAGMNDVCMKPIRADIFNKLLNDRMEAIYKEQSQSSNAQLSQTFLNSETDKASPANTSGGALVALRKLNFDNEIKLLTVDDNNWILMNSSRIPSEFKYKMESALNADTAFKKYLDMVEKGMMYHLIFIDVKMPKKDGIELTKEIRKYETDNHLRKTYICGMKTDDDDPDDKIFLQSGMNDVCFKPMKPDIFNKILKDRLATLDNDLIPITKVNPFILKNKHYLYNNQWGG